MTAQTAFVHIQTNPDKRPRLMHRVSEAWVLLRLSFLLLCTSALALPALSFAQAAKPANASSSPAAGKRLAAAPHKPTVSGPLWSELTALQQQTLKPLALSWNTISEAQKRKWLEISKNYPSLSPEEQATMRSRMNEWVALSPQQRAQARLNFAKTRELSRELTTEEKKEKWLAYQALSAEEKRKLAAKASPKPPGAATAVKPVAPQKLAVPPQPAQPASRPAPKIMLAPATTVQPAPPRAGENAAGETGAEPKR
jgi:uncharacterized membrane protein